MNDLISVIVPIYNTGTPLTECVESIIAQTYSPIEIILVNDGSTDNHTLNILRLLTEKYDYIKVVHQQNGGSSKARNTGLEKANGKYIAFVDSDDKIDKDAYSNLHKYAVKYNVPLVFGNLQIEGTHQLFRNNGLLDGVYGQIEILSKFLQGYWCSTCTNLYRKDIIKDCRFPIGEINEDYLFNFKVICKCEQIAIFNKPFYHYIRRDESVTSKPASFKHLDWLRHTVYIRKTVKEIFGTRLSEEANFQYLFSNIVLSNKCVLNMAAGYKGETKEIYNIVTNNLKSEKWNILTNKYLFLKHRISGLLIIISPQIYKQVLLLALRFRK